MNKNNSLIRKLKIFASLLALMIPSIASAGPILNISGGQLTGAQGVMVGENSYTVQFLEGSCISLLKGCDEASDGVFSTFSEARAANRALQNTVFINSSLGNFDTRPNLTFGCRLSIQCLVYTHYAIGTGTYVNSSSTDNRYMIDDPAPANFESMTSKSRDTAFNDRTVIAVWTPTPVSVPEPSTIALLVISLVGLGWARNRKLQKC